MAKHKSIIDDVLTNKDGGKRSGEPHAVVTYWINEINAAKKREKDYRKEGNRILEIYSGEKKDAVPFNILYSNTCTLLPALYSAIPRPVVARRFKDDDPLGKAAATAGQRVLEFLVDTNVEGYETYDEGMRAATLDALLPGRGITCVKYDAEIGVLPTESVDDEEPASEDAKPVAKEELPLDEYKQSELVCVDTRSWDRVYFGYAKKWSKMPWIAYEEHIDLEESERLFGKKTAAKIVYTAGEESDRYDERRTEDERNQGERKTACVYQIWDKQGGKKLRYISPQYTDGFLKVEDDPLELTGFFNCPKPIQFVDKSNDLLPVAMYTIYENQAKELNEISRRINRIVRAIKAKAIYDFELGEDLKNLVEADDNELVPADKSSSLAAEKGLQNAIWFWPVEQLINVLTQLLLAREQCKRVIYEITGISDIIRGSSVASETATAQTLKSQWGTLRLKNQQKEVQRYARDLMRMMLEIAATKFSEETWAKMTGLPFVTTEQKTQLEQVVQAVKQQAAQMQAMGQQPTPQQMQQVQQLQAEMAKPVWGQVLEMLRNDLQRAYRIDIETNSTVEPEAVEDQKNISELMTALGQFLNGVGPLVAKGVMPFQAAQTMMLAITRRFRFGPEIEDQIKAMQAPKPEEDGNASAEKLAQVEQQAQQQIKNLQDAAKIEKNISNAQHQMELKDADLKRREGELTLKNQIMSLNETAAKAQQDATNKVSVMTVQGQVEKALAKAQQIADKVALQIREVQTTRKMSADGAAQQQRSGYEQKSVQSMEQMHRELANAIQAMTAAFMAPKTRTAIRGSDGRIAQMVEETA